MLPLLKAFTSHAMSLLGTNVTSISPGARPALIPCRVATKTPPLVPPPSVLVAAPMPFTPLLAPTTPTLPSIAGTDGFQRLLGLKVPLQFCSRFCWGIPLCHFWQGPYWQRPGGLQRPAGPIPAATGRTAAFQEVWGAGHSTCGCAGWFGGEQHDVRSLGQFL